MEEGLREIGPIRKALLLYCAQRGNPNSETKQGAALRSSLGQKGALALVFETRGARAATGTPGVAAGRSETKGTRAMSSTGAFDAVSGPWVPRWPPFPDSDRHSGKGEAMVLQILVARQQSPSS